MADTLPLNFPIPTENVLATYDYFDTVEGTGYINFYAAGAEHAGPTEVYFLTTQTITSAFNARSTLRSSAGTTEVNFDITIGNPLTLSGNAIINWTMRFQDLNSDCQMTYTLYHVRNSTETSIGTIQSGADDPLGSGGPAYRRNCVRMAVSQKAFAVGDILRLEVQMTNAGGSPIELYHDPSSLTTFTEQTTSATIGTDLLIKVPVKVQQ